MSFLEKIFGNGSSNNEQIICWVLDVLNVIEKAGPVLSFNCCEVQVIPGNNVRIMLQDWYDDFIPRFGPEHGLEKFFEMVPAGGSGDIFVSKITPHISGSPSQFINSLEQAMKSNQIYGYQRERKLSGCLRKGFHN